MNNQSTIYELMKFVEPIPESGCWLWMGETQDDNGYMEIDGETISADRLSWEVEHGAIPNGQCVFHKCKVWCCINPDHLFLKEPDISKD